jgi:hypothetical protein
VKIFELTMMPTATPAATTTTTTTNVAQDPAAQSKMMAQQALDRQTQKQELQDQIRNKEKEMIELRKKLAEIK